MNYDRARLIDVVYDQASDVFGQNSGMSRYDVRDMAIL
jgi:hypothetical protein